MGSDENSPQAVVLGAEPDHEASHGTQTTATESAALGLAFSGGGVRATLFSLGVVIGLIETGCHRRVRCVSSVSGGSILNAVLAHSERSLASFEGVKEFEGLATQLASTLASRGIFAFDWKTAASNVKFYTIVLWRTIPSLLGAVMAFLAAGSAIADALRPQLPILRRAFEFVHNVAPWRTLEPFLIGFLLFFLLLLVVFRRGRFQEAKFASGIEAIAGKSATKSGLLVKYWGAGTPHDVMHVLVAGMSA